MITEIHAKSILRKQKKIDSWFLSSYGMNLYRGCTHACAYCDGRAEKYQVDGEFGVDLQVKINAIDILSRELDPKHKRTPWKPGYMLVGGGVCDGYQPAEIQYGLSRQVLQLLLHYSFPIHLLTKSSLIERDIDLIVALHEKQRAIVSMSFSTVDDRISRVFEAGAARPSRRLQTLETMKKRGLPIGMFLMPVIPFVSDTPEQINASVLAAKNAGVDFIIFGGMTLKPGRQRDYFMHVLNNYNPILDVSYDVIYSHDPYGQAVPDYYASLLATFFASSQACHMPVRMPPCLWSDLLSENERVVVFLEHIDYMLKMRGQHSAYGYAAWNLSQVAGPLSLQRSRLDEIKGVGKTIAAIVREILDTGSCRFYEWLLAGKTWP
jgi:DNA repair photolyase